MNRVDSSLGPVIEQVVRSRFSDDVIQSVKVEETQDHDGDDVFVVNVVFSGAGPLDEKKTSSIIRYIRRELRELGDERFPIISFMSEGDAARMRPEAA